MKEAIYTEREPKAQDMVSHAYHRFKDTGKALPPAQRWIYERLAKITGRKSIIEAGCGVGIGTAILKGKPFVYKGQEAVHRIVLGTDVDIRHIEYASQVYPYQPFDLWNIEEGPFPAKLFDLVVAVEVLEHCKDYEKALRNLSLTCREGVWLSTPNRQSPELQQDTPRNPHHVREFTPAEVLDLAGPYFTEIEVMDWRSFSRQSLDTQETPLVYHLTL